MTRSIPLLLLVGVAAAGTAGAQACSGRGAPAAPSSGPPGAADAGPPPFEAVPAPTYVAKAKNLLVGLPPTDAELAAVSADPAQLAPLVEGWMALPQYTDKMRVFFELAFQQTQVTIADFDEQTFPKRAVIDSATAPLLVQNAEESFARTMLELVAQGRPLTEAATTRTFMMTPALMELYALLDAWQIDDANHVTDRFALANPGVSITLEASAGPIPLADSIDPASPSYMHWYNPGVASLGTAGAGCAVDPLVVPASAITLHYLLHGSIDNHRNASGAACGQIGGNLTTAVLTADDFSTWKMVTVRQPAAGESPTRFYDLPALRSSSELVLTIPRVGFFGTPAFFANWQTNVSNQMRVTANQALIVATGASVDGNDPTAPATTPGLDPAHAAPGSACFGCHQLLDPTRSILSSAYSFSYHDQTDAGLIASKGLFAFEGVIAPVSSVADFAGQLASHPLFAPGWAEKLCFYVNSAGCDPTDPEFSRVVGVFKSSGYSWNALVKELLSSPLTTYAAPTKSALASGEVVAVARRDHLSAALNARLGFADVCGLRAATKAAAPATVPEIVAGLPSDGYGRGSVAPVLPNQPTLFFRAGTENICEAIAASVIDPKASAGAAGNRSWSSTEPAPAIADFVALVMGLPPSDPRASQATSILTSHFAEAQKSGASASDALKSTFVAACLSPSAVSIGL